MNKKAISLIIIALLSINMVGCNSKKDNNISTEGAISEVVNSNIEEENSNEENSTEEKDDSKDKEENENKEETNKNQKNDYLNKLDKVQNSIKDLDYLYSTGDAAKMNAAATDELKRWEDALDEIYKNLEKQLSKDEISKLKKEQEEWSVNRDNKAKRESLEMEGTSSEALLYTQSLGQSTKMRCYELVEKYM